MARPRDGRSVALSLAVLIVLSTVIPVVGAASAGEVADDKQVGQSVETERTGSPVAVERTGQTDTARAQATGATIDVHQEFSLTPDEPGAVTVQLRYEIPDRVTQLRTEVPESATVTSRDGFTPKAGTTYQWDNASATATITYTYPVNETVRGVGPEGAEGRYLFVDAGEWALFRHPQIRTRWRFRGAPAVSIDKQFETDGPGVVGEWLVYLGEVRRHERTAHGQTFNLIVPRRATLAESPEDVLDSLATASDQLRIGDRDEQVNVFVAPTTTVEWGVRGLSYGDRDLYVRDVEPLATAENTWLHEYVHSRQDFETTSATEWVSEATATYYAALFALEQDRISLATFREQLRKGTLFPQNGAVLASPRTWRNGANYLKGMLVAGDIDRRIRLASDSEYSLQSVLSAMNAADEPVRGSTFLEFVGGVAGASTGRAAEVYTTTQEVPEVWSPSAHTAAFATEPARLTLQFAETVEVTGPYRNTTLADPPRVYVNETVTVSGEIRNVGGVATDAVGIISVDGRRLTEESARLGPGDGLTVTATYTFTEAGEHTISFGSDTIEVQVTEPARASVSASSVNRTELTRPGAVSVTATVSNNRSVPATKTVTFRKNGDGFAKRTVLLGPGESEQVVVTTRLPAAGEYVLRAGRDDPHRVVVGDGGNGATENDSETSGESGPGFALLTGAAAVGFAVLAWRRRHLRRR